jgi:hypothetical protein
MSHSNILKAEQLPCPHSALIRLATAYSPPPLSGDSLNSGITDEKPLTDLTAGAPSPAYQPKNNDIESVQGPSSTQPFVTTPEREPIPSNSNQPSRYPHLPRLVRNNLDPTRKGRAMPFIWKNELSRGALEMITATFQYSLM